MAEPVNIDTKFSAADQTLAFTLCWFATDRTMSEKDHRLYAGILGDVLPFVTEDHPIVAPMVEISKQIVSTIENGGHERDEDIQRTGGRHGNARQLWQVHHRNR